MKTKNFSSICICFLAFSCSSLKVEVDILNREALLKSDEYRSFQETQERYQVKNSIDEVKIGLFELESSIPEYIDFAIAEESVAKESRSDFTNQITIIIDTIRSGFLERVSQAYYHSSQSNEVSNQYQLAVGRLLKDLAGLKAYVQELIGENNDKVSEQFSDLVSRTVGKPIEKFSTPVSNLLGDPLASYVVYGDEKKFWKNYGGKYNLAKVNTQFGNSDIAISMEEPGNYVIKGVRLDPSDVLKASFKTIKTGISILAASQGATINFSQSDSKISDYVLATDSLNEVTRLRQEYYSSSSIQLLKFINNQKMNLESGDSVKVRAAIQAITEQTNSFKESLKK